MSYVLDTNIVIAGLKDIPVVRERLNQHERAELGVPLVVLAELCYGAHKSQRRQENLAGLKRLRETFTILPMTEAIAERYGAIRAELERRGLPKSDLDLIVVATALENGATLVTNERGLKELPLTGLQVEDWLSPPGPAR